MGKRWWSTTLIVVRPESPNIVKFRFTRAAILIVVLSGVVAFLSIIALQHAVGPISLGQRNRLERENHELRVINLNIATSEATVEPEVAQLEQD